MTGFRIALAALPLLSAIPAAAAPGQMVAATPLTDAAVPAGAQAWRIRYETTDRRGRRTESTGLLFAPAGDAPREGRPVVAWTHGTFGIAEKCAPSRLLPAGIRLISGLDAMLARGWAVVATDYPGLGTSGSHEYLVGEAAARAALDSVRAAGRVAGAATGRDFAVMGHSQGGHAALWTGARARAYSPELRLRAVVAISPPTDLPANFAAATPAARGLLGSYVGASWSLGYGLPLSDLGNRTTQRLIRQLAQVCVGQGTALTRVQGLRLILRQRKLDLTRIPRWNRLLVANSAAGRIGAPLLVAQGLRDEVVAPRVTAAYVARQCAWGARVRSITVPDGDHMIPDAVAPQAVAWLADRFAGAPDAEACR